MMLAFDTCNGFCSAAITKNGHVIDFIFESEKSKQAEKLLSLVNTLFLRNEITLANIKEVAVSVGPGSFAGVKIGVAVAKSFALFGITPIRVGVLDAIAFNLMGAGNIIDAVLDPFFDTSEDHFVYHQSFTQDLTPIAEPKSIKRDELNLNYSKLIPDAKLIANCATYLKQTGKASSNLDPIYVRNAV